MLSTTFGVDPQSCEALSPTEIPSCGSENSFLRLRKDDLRVKSAFSRWRNHIPELWINSDNCRLYFTYLRPQIYLSFCYFAGLWYLLTPGFAESAYGEIKPIAIKTKKHQKKFTEPNTFENYVSCFWFRRPWCKWFTGRANAVSAQC